MDEQSLIMSVLAGGLAHCRAVAIEHGNLLGSLFLAGLIGSATHCTGMCGPFVLAQTMARLEQVPSAEMREFHRLRGAALLPYHLGRATTYALLGAILASLAGGLVDVADLRALSAGLLVLAALFFAGYGLRALKLPIPWLGSGGAGWWTRTFGSVARPLFRRPVGWRGYLLGVALGFLPCGLLYGALAAAAAAGDAAGGALGMLAFTLGTVPALIAIGLAGHVVSSQWRGAAARAMPMLMLLNAAVLSYFAWQMML